MYSTIIVSVVVILACLLVFFVLIQKSKGGGLAAGFQSSNQFMGAPKTADFLEKATWTLMGVIALLCIISVKLTDKPVSVQSSALQGGVNSTMQTTENVADAPAADAVELPAAEEAN